MAKLIHPIDEDFLAEDGHPIGQLVMADNTERSLVDNSLEIAEATLTKEKEDELGTDLELYPGYADLDKKQEAKSLYIVSKLPVEVIAERLGIPERTVIMWIYNERWDSVVRKEILVQDMQAKLDLARTRLKYRNDTAKDQLKQARTIRKHALDAIVNDGKLKGGADAWAAAARIEQTILGIKEGGDLASVDGKSSEDNNNDTKKQPLVVVFNGGLPAATRR